MVAEVCQKVAVGVAVGVAADDGQPSRNGLGDDVVGVSVLLSKRGRGWTGVKTGFAIGGEENKNERR